MPAERERFPVPDAAVVAAVEAEGLDARGQLRNAAPSLIAAWIDGLTDDELLSLKFAGKDWCTQMRAELRRLAEDPSA